MAAAQNDKVKAVVISGSYSGITENGERKIYHAGMGKESECMVPRSHLDTFAGVIVAAEKAEMAIALARQHSIATGATSTAEVAPADDRAAADRRRGRPVTPSE